MWCCTVGTACDQEPKRAVTASALSIEGGSLCTSYQGSFLEEEALSHHQALTVCPWPCAEPHGWCGPPQRRLAEELGSPLGKASCPVAPPLSTRAPSALPSMLTWPVPDPRQSSHRIALPAGAWVNVCTLGCHRNTFLCKVETQCPCLPKQVQGASAMRLPGAGCDPVALPHSVTDSLT